MLLPSASSDATPRTYTGLFLICLATLMYQILLTRIFSVTMLYHFAFAAVSLAMFGMTAGALFVYLRPQQFPASTRFRQLAVYSLLFAVSMVVSFLTQASIPFRIHPSIVAIYALAFTFAVVAVPFVFGGIAVAIALTRFPKSVGRLYAADLCGAALGCVLIIFLLDVTDGPTAVVAVAAIAACGAWWFALDSGSKWIVGSAAAVALLLALAAAAHTVLVWREFPVLRLLYVKGEFEARPLYERWNSYSRVRVTGNPDALEKPFAWGLSSVYPENGRVNQLRMDIDVAAGTVLTRYSGRPEETAHLRMDVTNIGYYIRSRGDVLVIGTGGGRDILSALDFGAKSVTGVELNPNIIATSNRRFGEFTGHLDRDPRVRFVNDEARSYITRQDDTYDVIQISLIDTWAATASGAFVLSENSLYTVEAWDIFLDRLSPTGVLSVSRWYFRDRPAELYRSVALASAALARRGIAEPRKHMAIVRNMQISGRTVDLPDGVGTLLVSPSPLSESDISTLETVARDLKFDVPLSPNFAADATFEHLTSGRDLEAFTASYPVNIAPPTDDSPFFFNMLRLRDILAFELSDAGKQAHNMRAVIVLGTLLATVTLLTAVCILGPLLATRRQVSLGANWPLVSFFAAIGLGFMLVETSQVQRLIVFLGHPTYGLSVVLFALLLSSGIGSFLTQGVRDVDLGAAGAWRLMALLVVLVAFGVLTPAITGAATGATTPARIAIAVALLSPPGLFMGMAFPLGMRLAGGRAAALTPWLWGVNGATSVLAAVLSVAIALSWSISTSFWTGVAAYVMAWLAFRGSAGRPGVPAQPAR
jgi:hypothetical protein